MEEEPNLVGDQEGQGCSSSAAAGLTQSTAKRSRCGEHDDDSRLPTMCLHIVSDVSVADEQMMEASRPKVHPKRERKPSLKGKEAAEQEPDKGKEAAEQEPDSDDEEGKQSGKKQNLLDFYSYRLIGKLTAFLQLHEFSLCNQIVDSSTTSARLFLLCSNLGLEIFSPRLQLYALRLI